MECVRCRRHVADARRPLTVERVLAAAIKVLRDEGPSGLTVRRLAEVVGVSRQVVYTQFGSLGGLIDALYREGFARLRASGTEIDSDLHGTELVVAAALDVSPQRLGAPGVVPGDVRAAVPRVCPLS